jgi:hypothetical protein
MSSPDDQFRIRRFRLLDGQDLTLYCRLLKARAGVAASYRLYEDSRGLKWMEISLPRHSSLVRLSDESFEQRVADELLTLGLNKYSG